ncbi:MAG: hypothetical protein JO257_00210 [Deltaproteobacteria bacterium]|nr:hypothetical protein [Deltaproteobacteria bacterium]
MVWWLRRPREAEVATGEVKAAVPTAQPSTAPAMPVEVARAAPQVPPGAEAPIVPPAAPPIELPPDTELLQKEFVPGTTEWEEVPEVEGSTHVIRFLPAKYNVVAPAPIVLYLEVLDTSTKKRVAIANPRVRVRPFDHEDQWFDAIVADDGRGADEVAGDFRYTATLVPSDAQRKALVGHVLAEGIVESREGGVRRIPQGLIYTNGPRARLTGKWKDEVREGSLFVSAELDVETAGQFTLMAQLVGPAREPIALTRAMGRLDAGTQWMTMRVWGKAIRDSGVSGPYEVRNVLLTRDLNERGDYDPGPTVISAHHTAAYKVEQFSDAPYVEAPVARGEEIGPTHPSQWNNPPPLYPQSARKTAQTAP